MSRALAVLRADASRAIGTGHVVRSLALAEFLARAGWRIVFAQSGDSLAASPSAIERYERITLGAADAEAEAVELGRRLGACELLVVDHYGRDRRFETACRDWARQILVLDDLADRPHGCAVLVDAAREPGGADYRGLVPADCTLLLGPDFALLRDQFLAARQRARLRRQTARAPERIVISIGGIDAADVTSRALAAALQAAPQAAIDVVLGRAAPHLDRLRSLVEASRRPVRLLSDVADMAALLAEADIGIGAAGSSAWERCCLGLPSIVLPVVDNQGPTVDLLEKRGAALILPQGARATASEIADALKRLLGDARLRGTLSERSMALCDGRGGWRVLLALLPEERARDGRPVSLRLAERSDCDLMFAWQTMPEVRRYARYPELPSLAEHVAWVEASLTRPDRVLTLILHDGLPVGVLRFDRLDATPIQEISILLDPRLHGRGIAAAALRLGQNLFRGAVLHAEVDPANTASRRLFQQAGFHAIDARRFDWSHEPQTIDPTAPTSAAAEVSP